MSDEERKQAEENILDHAKLVFQHFSPKEGDIVAISVPEEMSEEQAYYLSTIIRNAVPDGVQAVMLLKGVTMEMMTEEEMNSIGWQRITRH